MSYKDLLTTSLDAGPYQNNESQPNKANSIIFFMARPNSTGKKAQNKNCLHLTPGNQSMSLYFIWQCIL